MKKLLATLAGIAAAIALTTPAAAKDAGLHLQITPALCIVDVVQDGNNQVLQTPSPDCETALPILLHGPAAPPHAAPLFSLPFAGRRPSPEQPIFRPGIEGSLTPIGSRTSQSANASDPNRPPVAITSIAVGALVIAAGVGIDLALFEFHYSKAIARWTHRQTAGRVLKK